MAIQARPSPQARRPNPSVSTGKRPPGLDPRLDDVTAASPVPERRRPRPGSLERPVNARLYRGTWLLVGLPLLLLAFSVARPPALQAPNLPPAFNGSTAAAIAEELASDYPDRRPGTPGGSGAAAWFRQQLKPYGFHVHSEQFAATIHGRETTLVNLVAEKSGIGVSPPEIVVMAHRDDTGIGDGLDDNASGTAALIELARSYAPTAGAQRISLPYSLVFLSTDGGSDGSRGAAHFAAEQEAGQNVLAVVTSIPWAATGRPGSCSAPTRPVLRRPGSSRPCAPRSPGQVGTIPRGPARSSSSSGSAFRSTRTSRRLS